ncbi:Hypothetical protein CINCED_3A022753 [Cinara cedri]|uniref:Helicase senataxin n=1 Tax=Cinara cedri TaxID=506608 RepID=A0A5E4MUY7_9HEMI|nr:Hypothetical protein CINCED_3A022753 [Cinara cedri]
METIEDCKPGCALKCLRNVEDISDSIHPLKYGMTSNGTIVGNINLLENKEHQLNDLDMIVLASGDEGVVLQFINQIDRTIDFSNLYINQMNNKRKIPSVENLDELTAVKVPRLVPNGPDIFKKPLLNESTFLSSKPNDSPYVTNNLQYINLNQPSTSSNIVHPIKDDNCKISVADVGEVLLNNVQPSSSNCTIITPVEIKTEPNISQIQFSQGTYRSEEDSVIVIYSSDEENNVIDNNSEQHKIIKIEHDEEINSKSSTENAYPSTSKVENNLNSLEWENECYEILSDDGEDLIDRPSKLNSKNDTSMSVNDVDSNSKMPQIIEPLPLKPNIKKGQSHIPENENIIKTRAKSEKKSINKKKAEKMTVDQNKQIIETRRNKLKALANNNFKSNSTNINTLIDDQSITDDTIDKPSTTDILNRKTRKSRFPQINNNNNCKPSTSKANLTTEPKKNEQLNIQKKVTFNSQQVLSLKPDNQLVKNVSLNCNNMDSSSTSMTSQVNFSFYDTLSRICKWNAVWLYEQKFTNGTPPLVKCLQKMKGQFENSSEYSAIIKPLLLHEVWSNISESYNMLISKNPSLEKCFIEKTLKNDIPLLTFSVQSVNTEFSSSIPALKHIKEALWSIKCIETKGQNRRILTESRFSLKGCLCIVVIPSKHFSTDTIPVKKPTKSRNIFFAYVNTTRKIGYQLCIDLIVTRKTEQIPNGTPIHLMDIFYLHSELRLFQAIDNITTSPLKNALITPQLHNYTIDYSKVNLKKYNVNSLTLNNSQKEAVEMAVSICSSREPNIGLIIGPPGTGKTNVICNIVLTVISKLRTEINVKPKFLVCAPSNEAVDTIVRQLVEIKNEIQNKLQFNVVRVGAGQKYDSHSPIVDVLLDNIVKQKMNFPLHEADQQGKSNTYFQFMNKRDIEKDVLQNTDIVVTTLNSCFSQSMEDAFMPSKVKALNSCHFTACIVDEAGQCVEPLNCVPLILGIDKLILVGDDKQLQPLIKSKVAKDHGLGISLFKRLKTWFEQKRYTRKNKPITMLDTQYRMHNEICLFPSLYFYGGKMKSAESVSTRMDLSFQPYIILEHESRQDNSGELNNDEALMVVSLVEIVLNSDCNSLTIAILTPYHKQREHINMLLERKGISINVNTVDSFQGGECDILLISTVRTTGVGFMDDICRLNVALTRAKQSLIICGNFMSLKGERVWCDLLDNAKKRKLIKKVSKKSMTNSRALLAMIKY